MMRSCAFALYRFLARALLPPSFRRDYGQEIQASVDARLSSEIGVRGLLRVTLVELSDLAWTVAKEWFIAGREWWVGATRPSSGNHERLGRGEGIMGGIWKDLRIAARNLARRPGFSLGVALTLGLGIGATTTIYGVVDGVILRPLPYEDPSELVTVGAVLPTSQWLDPEANLQDVGTISMVNYQALRERARSFEALATINIQRLLRLPSSDGGFEAVDAPEVSPALFDMLGVTPVLGRAFLPEEYAGESGAVAMITHQGWQRRYGGDPAVVGRPLGGTGAILVGVLPEDFRPLDAFLTGGHEPGRPVPDFYLPSGWEAPGFDPSVRRAYALGRLSQGTSLEEARAEAARIAADQATRFPQGNLLPDGSHVGIGVNELHAQTVGGTGKALGLFLGAAAMLLLLAAMNAATLLLARSLDRTRELGVRMALGAGRARIVRLLVSEAGILTAAGGALGVLLAYGGVGAFLRYAPQDIPRLSTVAVDARVLFAAAVVSLATGIAAGLLPALRLTGRGPWQRLSRGGRTVAEPTSHLRAVLVAGQMTVAIVLLSGAGLLFNSFVRMVALDPGFEADGLVTLSRPIKGSVFELAPGNTWLGWDVLLDKLRAVPGVESVAGTTSLPFSAPYWSPKLLLPGDPPETSREGIGGYTITPGYLETMGTELLQGRDFELLDGPDAEPVALVNESFVRTQLGGADPIDIIIRVANPDGFAVQLTEYGEEIPMRIVGVVEDVVQRRAEEGSRPAIYVPYTQYVPMLGIVAVVRTTLASEVIFPDLHRVSAWFNSSREVTIGTMRGRMARTRISPLFQTMLIGAFALVATLLAATGLYGSLAHSVGRRQRELGVRMALGADRAGVLRMVLGQGMRLSMAGLAVGMIAALFFTRVLTSFLYRVEPNDPATLLMVGVVLVLVSAVACLAPARTATAVDPVRVLKAE